jgi:pimeloyl-ACP methyl ester carboxylesterase
MPLPLFALTTSAALILAAASPAPVRSPEPLDRVTAAVQTVMANTDKFQKSMGEYETSDLVSRLDDDISALAFVQPPDGVALDDWNQRLADLARLDSSIVTQVQSGTIAPLGGVHGLDERIVASHADGRLQPVALYVPDSAGPHPSLVVLLHGRQQSETEILVPPYFRKLADATGTIVIAPNGRGSYDFAQPAADDVYQITEAVVAAYNVDRRRVYLAGYSMGGFSVFSVGPLHASRWTAIMCVSGAILNSETDLVRMQLSRTPIYMVTGKRDTDVPSRYGELTASFLAGVGILTEFDEESAGTHYLATLMPSLTIAWNDMLSGVVKHPPPSSIAQMPGMTPPIVNDAAHP